MRCVDTPHAMAAVRSGQGCLTLCGDKRDLWLPRFLSQVNDAVILCESLPKRLDKELQDARLIDDNNCQSETVPSHANQKAAKTNKSTSNQQGESRIKRPADALSLPYASAKRPQLQ